MRCPLCDGTVSGGRCRDCGMPYRNDDLLYHLNEDRREHEKHASEKVKEELRKRMVPLGDAVQKQNISGKKNTGAQKNAGKISHDEIRRKQQQIRQEAVQRMTAGRNISEPSVGEGKNKKASAKALKNKKKKSSWEQESSGKKKNPLTRWIFWIIAVLMIIAPSIEDVLNGWKGEETYYAEDLPDSDYSYADLETKESDSPFLSSWSDSDGNVEYGFGAGAGKIHGGTDIIEGDYRVYTNEEEIILVCEQKTDIEEITLKEGDSIELKVEQGDVFYLKNTRNSYDSVYFQSLGR